MPFPASPLFTEEDLEESAEGTLDPLGLFAAADRLATRLAPGVRERMSRPRFLTSLAISLHLASYFDEEEAALDGTEPWLAFEWILVEGLFRELSQATEPDAVDELRGVPGRRKINQAIRAKQSLTKARYLKSPGVFGVHGVYRQLARELGVENGSGDLGERGVELLRCWQQEQELPGFLGTEAGEGKRLRESLVAEMRQILQERPAHTHSTPKLWRQMADHLNPSRSGPKEQELLLRWLREANTPTAALRPEVLRFLKLKAGQQALDRARDGDERAFHDFILQHPRVSSELSQWLAAVQAYERVARLLQCAFDDCLCEMSRSDGGLTTPMQLTGRQGVRATARGIAAAYRAALAKLEISGEGERFRANLEPLAEPRLPADQWVMRLMEHHFRVQKGKEKRSWIERSSNGAFILRAAYRRSEPGLGGEAYVHNYRSRPLRNFLNDLEAS